MGSLRLRFCVLAAAMVAGIVAVLGSGIYLALDRQLHTQVDSRLQGRATDLQRVRSLAPQSAGQPRVIAGPGIAGPGRRGGGPLYFGVDSSGRVAFRTASAEGLDLHVPADVLQQALSGRELLTTVGVNGQEYRLDLLRASQEVTNATLLTADDQRAVRAGMVVVAALPLQSIADTLDPLRLLLAAAVIAGLGLGAAAGLAVANRALVPLSRLSSAVESVGTGGDLTTRLPATRGHDEVAALARAFNASLDRIEAAYRELERLLEGQRRFVADASHELRTPLTVMRADVAMLEKYPTMSEDDREALISRSRGEVERMSRLARDLLEQARSETGVATVRRDAPLDWDALLAAVTAELRELVAPRAVAAHLTPAGMERVGDGHGDGDVVRRIVRVIAENIAQHTSGSTGVAIDVAVDGDDLAVTIGDDGPGVDRTFLPAMFDRFARGDHSRTVPGSGLGLAIAMALARAHGGRIEAALGDPGMRMTIHLPMGRRAAGNV